MRALYILFQLGLTALVIYCCVKDPTVWNGIWVGSSVMFDLCSLPRWLGFRD